MNARRLYRVTMERRYNGGRGDERLEGADVLYCGYDRLEAVRVYHANPGHGHDVPGHYFTRPRCQSKPVEVAADA